MWGVQLVDAKGPRPFHPVRMDGYARLSVGYTYKQTPAVIGGSFQLSMTCEQQTVSLFLSSVLVMVHSEEHSPCGLTLG